MSESSRQLRAQKPSRVGSSTLSGSGLTQEPILVVTTTSGKTKSVDVVAFKAKHSSSQVLSKPVSSSARRSLSDLAQPDPQKEGPSGHTGTGASSSGALPVRPKASASSRSHAPKRVNTGSTLPVDLGRGVRGSASSCTLASPTHPDSDPRFSGLSHVQPPGERTDTEYGSPPVLQYSLLGSGSGVPPTVLANMRLVHGGTPETPTPAHKVESLLRESGCVEHSFPASGFRSGRKQLDQDEQEAWDRLNFIQPTRPDVQTSTSGATSGSVYGLPPSSTVGSGAPLGSVSAIGSGSVVGSGPAFGSVSSVGSGSSAFTTNQLFEVIQQLCLANNRITAAAERTSTPVVSLSPARSHDSVHANSQGVIRHDAFASGSVSAKDSFQGSTGLSQQIPVGRSSGPRAEVQRLRQPVPAPPLPVPLNAAQLEYLRSLSAQPSASTSCGQSRPDAVDEVEESGDEDFSEWNDDRSVDSLVGSDAEDDFNLLKEKKSLRLKPLVVLQSLCPDAVSEVEESNRVMSSTLKSLALKDFEAERILLLPSAGSKEARSFAEILHRTDRHRKPIPMPEVGVPSFPGCTKRGNTSVYQPDSLKSVPLAKVNLPRISLVDTADKVFNQSPGPITVSSKAYDRLEKQLSFGIESAAKADSFLGGLANSLGESSLEEADPFTGSAFKLTDPCEDPRKVVVMLTQLALALNETLKCLSVLRQNMVSLKRDQYLPPTKGVLTEDQCDSLRSMPAFQDSLFDGRLRLAKKRKSEEKRDDSFLGLRSQGSYKPKKRAPSNRGSGSGKKARFEGTSWSSQTQSSLFQYPSAQRGKRAPRGSSSRGSRGASGSNRRVHPQ